MTSDEHSDDDNGNPRQSHIPFSQRLRPAGPGSRVASQLVAPVVAFGSDTHAKTTVVAESAIDKTVEDGEDQSWNNQVQRKVDKVDVYLQKTLIRYGTWR